MAAGDGDAVDQGPPTRDGPFTGQHASLFVSQDRLLSYALVLANEPSWNGLVFYTTSAVLTDPPQNDFGLMTANGIAGTLGLQ